MNRLLAYLYLLAAGLGAGAQLFFAAISAQTIFTKAVAALPPGDPARSSAATLVGLQLAQLDRLTLTLTSVAALCAIFLARRGLPSARRAALPVLLAGLGAFWSSAWITPQIQALRAAGETATPRFAQLHGLSGGVLLLELLLLALSLWIAPYGRAG